MSRIRNHILVAVFATILQPVLANYVKADTTLPSILGSNMVLQRGKSVPVWGWDNAGQTVTVEFNGQSASTKADSNGRWQVDLSR